MCAGWTVVRSPAQAGRTIAPLVPLSSRLTVRTGQYTASGLSCSCRPRRGSM